APVSTDDAYSVNEDATLTVAAAGVIDNDGDLDGDTLAAVLVSGPAHGSLTLNADGSFSYTPGANYNGADSFTYKANDGNVDGNVATVSIAVHPVNDVPQVDYAIPDQMSSEDTAFTYQVPANTFSDVDGDVLSYSATRANGNALPAWLAFDPVTRTFSGTPPLDYNGSINVRVIASDGSLSTSDVFELTITPVDDPGIARTDRFTINDTRQVDGNVFSDNGAGPDTDPENILQVGAVLRGAAAVGANYVLPSGATVRIDSDGHILYTPGPAQAQLAAPGSGASNTSFVDTFSYSLVGGGTADVIVTVQGTDGYDTLLGSAGNDNLRAGLFDDVLIGGLGSDALDGGAGTDTASYAGDPGAVFVNLTLGRGYANSSFGDTYTSIENVTGSIFNDFLIGDTGVNRLEGGAGNDTIIGGLGADVLIGGPGVDTLSFEDNSGTVFVNLLTGMGYNNAAQGDTYSGFENVIGGLFDDTIIGDNGNNRLDGAMGAD
ncbi:tandem-95 repeat protein, partial [Tsuneonella sp. HG222]